MVSNIRWFAKDVFKDFFAHGWILIEHTVFAVGKRNEAAIVARSISIDYGHIWASSEVNDSIGALVREKLL